MELHYQLTAEDLSLSLQKEFAARKLRRWLVWLCLFSVGVLLVPHIITGARNGFDSMWVAIDLKSTLLTLAPLPIIASVWILYYWFGIPRLAAKHFLQLKSLQREKHLQLSELGIRFADETGSSLIPWGDMFRWSRSEVGFIIYLGERNFVIVPKRAFATIEMAVAFQDQLISHQIPMK